MSPQIMPSLTWRKRIERLKIRPKQDTIVAVDGGWDAWIKFGFLPHFWIGDGDSLSQRGGRRLLSSLDASSRIHLSSEKNRSDYWHALNWCFKSRFSEIVGLGFSGGRPDHHLAALQDSAEILSRTKTSISVKLHGSEGDYYFLYDHYPSLKLKLPVGQTFSLFSMSSAVTQLKITGAKYVLSPPHKLFPSSQGLSNISIQKRCLIRLSKGVLLAIVPH